MCALPAGPLVPAPPKLPHACVMVVIVVNRAGVGLVEDGGTNRMETVRFHALLVFLLLFLPFQQIMDDDEIPHGTLLEYYCMQIQISSFCQKVLVVRRFLLVAQPPMKCGCVHFGGGTTDSVFLGPRCGCCSCCPT